MFVIPSFPLTCTIYTFDPAGGGSIAERLTSGCNLAWGHRVQVASTGGTVSPGILTACMTLLLPTLTDIRGPAVYGAVDQGDYVEVPSGSGRLYLVNFVDDIGKGFTNEHRAALISQSFTFGNWPSPIP